MFLSAEAAAAKESAEFEKRMAQRNMSLDNMMQNDELPWIKHVLESNPKTCKDKKKSKALPVTPTPSRRLVGGQSKRSLETNTDTDGNIPMGGDKTKHWPFHG